MQLGTISSYVHGHHHRKSINWGEPHTVAISVNFVSLSVRTYIHTYVCMYVCMYVGPYIIPYMADSGLSTAKITSNTLMVICTIQVPPMVINHNI